MGLIPTVYTAIFHICPCCYEEFPTVLTVAFPAPFFSIPLAMILPSTTCPTIHGVGMPGFKGLPAVPASKRKRLSDGMFSFFYQLIAFPALDPMAFKLCLSLPFLWCRF